jgi:hypothetical protein
MGIAALVIGVFMVIVAIMMADDVKQEATKSYRAANEKLSAGEIKKELTVFVTAAIGYGGCLMTAYSSGAAFAVITTILVLFFIGKAYQIHWYATLTPVERNQRGSRLPNWAKRFISTH